MIQQIKQIIFDMDNTLIDTRASIDQTVLATLRHFGANDATIGEIHALRMGGGFNNDWNLISELLKRRGSQAPYNDIVAMFNRVFWGDDFNGMITFDRWMLNTEELQSIATRFELAIFTGRLRNEADFALRGRERLFSRVITHDDVTKGKPDPEGIRKALRPGLAPAEAVYIGDNLDDLRSAHGAGARFVGVVPPGHAFPDRLKAAFAQHDALCILDRIEDIETILNTF